MIETPHMLAHLGPEKTEAIKLALKEAEADGTLVCGAWRLRDGGQCALMALYYAFTSPSPAIQSGGLVSWAARFLDVAELTLREVIGDYDRPAVTGVRRGPTLERVVKPQPVTAEYAVAHIEQACRRERDFRARYRAKHPVTLPHALGANPRRG